MSDALPGKLSLESPQLGHGSRHLLPPKGLNLLLKAAAKVLVGHQARLHGLLEEGCHIRGDVELLDQEKKSRDIDGTTRQRTVSQMSCV